MAGLVELCVASATKNHLLLAFSFVQILLTPAAYAFWIQRGEYQPESKKRTYANYFITGQGLGWVIFFFTVYLSGRNTDHFGTSLIEAFLIPCAGALVMFYVYLCLASYAQVPDFYVPGVPFQSEEPVRLKD